jgi:hypothetical protein
MSVQPDLNASDWSAAHRRREGGAEEVAFLREAGAPATLTSPGEIGTPLRGTGQPFGPPVVPDVEPKPLPATPVALGPKPRRRSRGVYLLRLWALVKMASLAYSTWWVMGSLHASPAATASAYGGVCLFAGFGARWRKRFFGPGQIVEPELYEEVGRWMYRIGIVLVLIGGAVVVARSLLIGR